MTVAVFEGDYRSTKDGTFDWDYVAAVLAKAREVLQAAVEDYQQK